MPRNVLLLIDSAETGGAETVFAEIARRLDRSRFNPHVGLLCDGWLTSQMEAAGIEAIRVPMSYGSIDYRLLLGIRRLVQERDIDVVHAHLFSTNLYASMACVFTDVPVISTFHGTVDVVEGDRAKGIKWRLVNSLSRYTVFVSEYLRQHFIARGFARPTMSRVIYNGVEVPRFRSASTRTEARRSLGISDDAFLVGCIGDVRPSKDYRTALQAAWLVRQSIPGVRVVIAGSETELTGPLIELRDSLGLKGVVDFIGFQANVEHLLPALDVYLSTSVSEGFSLTVVEAMAAGLPVVSTMSGGPQEIISNGVNGLLVPVGSPASVADAVVRLHRDRRFAAQLASAAAYLAEARFSVDSMLKNYEALYDEVTADAPRNVQRHFGALP